MNVIKKWFHRIIGWFAAPIAKTQTAIAKCMAPLIAIKNGIKIDWTLRLIGKVVLGGLLAMTLAMCLTAGIILSIAGLTLLFGLLLPSLVANVLAILITGYLIHCVYEAEHALRPDLIDVELV
jgi:hypothetical protein